LGTGAISNRQRSSPVDTALFAQAFEHASVYFLAASLAIARIGGIVMIMPAFTRLGATGIVRGGIAVAFALPLLPSIAAALATQQFTAVSIGILLLKEVTIGVVIGLVLGVPLWAAGAAGDILDFQRGSNLAGLTDPLAAVEEGITGTLFGLAMVALYYASGGVSLTLRSVYDSYAVWPAERLLPLFGPDAGAIFLGLLDHIVAMGIMLVAPLMVCLLLSDLTIALLSRAAPNFNLFALSLAVKNLVFAVFLALYCAFLIAYMGGDLASLLTTRGQIEGIGAVRNP
jgi:type III secretion protein T